MSWDQNDFLTRLKQTLDRFDRDGSALLCDELISHLHRGTVLGDGVGRRILTQLRRKAYFDQMERAAEALLFTSQDDAQIRRQYAQALIDQGKLTAAVYVLESLIARTDGIDPRENAESRGLLGRVYKQLYINAVLADPKAAEVPLHRLNLQRAVDAYLSVYRAAPARHLWHGINAAALVTRALHDNVALRESLDGKALATDILAALEARGDLDAWDLATGGEACLVLGDPDKALQWLARYVVRPEADAFELASTLRQIKEVWGLKVDTPPGSLLIPLLQSQLLQRSGGRVDLASSEVKSTIRKTEEHAENAVRLEKVLGKEGVVTLGWYKIGLDRAKVVAKILNPAGDGFGTGFLVRGKDLVPALGDEILLLTNAHVVSGDAAVREKYGSLEPSDATIIFEAFETVGQQQFKIKKLLWTSPPDQLDASLLRLDPSVPDCPPYSLTPNLPTQTSIKEGTQKVYVIGHPGGRTLSISLNDNLLLDYDDRLLHYRAPTEGGSSGSPVFNQQWQLIGLHHAGGMAMQRLNDQEGTYAANEGIWIQRIIKALGEAGISA